MVNSDYMNELKVRETAATERVSCSSLLSLRQQKSHISVAPEEASACEGSSNSIYILPNFNKTLTAMTNTRVTREIFDEGYEVKGSGKSFFRHQNDDSSAV